MQAFLDRIINFMFENAAMNRLLWKHVKKAGLRSLAEKLLNRETVLYLFFGALATVVSIGSFTLFDRLLEQIGWQGLFHLISDKKNYAYLDANTLSWIVTVLFAFFTNKLFVFESKSWERKTATREFFSFIAARLLSLGIDQVCMYLLVSIISLNKDLSKILVQVIIVLINYFLSKLFIFKGKGKAQGE